MNRDIDMGGCTWTTVIGGVAPYFTGSFNGAGYLITGLTIGVNIVAAAGGTSYVGLFGRTEAGSVIENVGFNGNISGTIDAVVLLGGLDHTLEIGGLVGGSRGGIVRQSFATGNVTGSVSARSGDARGDTTVRATGYAGGLIGRSESDIADSYATGSIDMTASARSDQSSPGPGPDPLTLTSSAAYSGGLIGKGAAGSIRRSYTSTGTMSTSSSAASPSGDISALGVNGGAIVDNDAPAEASAWNSTLFPGIGIPLGTQRGGFTGLSMTAMQDVTTFGPAGLNWDIAGDCALTQVWSLCSTRNDGFPTLSIFTLADRSGDDPEQAPPPILQQVGLLPGQRCADLDIPELNWAGVTSGGWGQSWAEWAVPVTGGPVCVRELFYDSPRSQWAVRS